MSEHGGERGVDGVEALREKILAMPPVESCGHLARDFNGNCFQCARDAEVRALKAQAWDEGWLAAWSPLSMHSLNDGPNPYRDTRTSDPSAEA